MSNFKEFHCPNTCKRAGTQDGFSSITLQGKPGLLTQSTGNTSMRDSLGKGKRCQPVSRSIGRQECICLVRRERARWTHFVDRKMEESKERILVNWNEEQIRARLKDMLVEQY